MYKRQLSLEKLLGMKSFFLFGPRATSKSTLIKAQLPMAHVFDLLDRSTFRRLLADPCQSPTKATIGLRSWTHI
jgi:hypothetical protein